MLRLRLHAVEIVHPESNKFATGVVNKATGGDSKVDDNPKSRCIPASPQGPSHKSVCAS